MSAEVTGDLSLLTRIADLQEKNIVGIRQWAGRAELAFHASRSADDYDFTQTVDVTFSQDRSADSICFSWVVKESFGSKRGQDDLVNSLKGFRAGELQVGSEYYKMTLSPPDPRVVTVLIGERAEPNIGGLSQLFYPMTYFRIWNEDSRDFFDRKVTFSDEKWMHTHLRQQGQLVILDTGGPKYPQYSKRYVFDLGQNGLLVEFKVKDPERSESQSQKYQEVSGVLLPAHTLYRNALHDGSEIDEKEVNWRDHIINKPFPPSAFTLEAMEVPHGAMVVDRRTRQSYRYLPKDLSPKPGDAASAAVPASPVKDSAKFATHVQRWWWLWMLLAVGLGGAVLTLFARRSNVQK